MRCFLVAALAVAAVAGALAQDDPDKAVDGFTYLVATDLLKTQKDDVIRSFDTAIWDNGLSPKGMHKCARYCRKEGGGGVCQSWVFDWAKHSCSLLSRLPEFLGAAAPGNLTYNAKAVSGYSEATATLLALTAGCKATIHTNTLIGDTLGFQKNSSRAVKFTYDAAQQSAVDCCALCERERERGCTSWSFQPDGWMLDRSRRCTLRTGINPSVTPLKGTTSGVMVA
ncbi:hypothetical protein Rsub_00388 [Raphidocelis subcapitata]|uniref:Apple domain-containing protein n=1 Tax=Raphidocelis subcapitata TaxID=307507 RepID=A0A2V0NRX2_9CHLO|nr:hypothetical protein Rsub_00388 [Raphidocelis subcapitata]|eukprot:GBF87677.1 hypothetical protein Rsub_00388 [Raphidocelis subcapitata]